ncbi:helix-turn-helix domain-containing protein [Desulfonatronovibrio hydrogenovorans]|uniref:helix-turn-helix domain-containing protein n=1 Tax=Desulfonatronovibrio hydrogenovorans TaxID=53245 RepID=UPI00048AB6C7|nr:helix-turn-helix domain-containing protein [Desulfonatronovibrio hydrogenovorans]
MKLQVIRNARRQIRQKKQEQKKLFAEKYNKTKEFHFPSKDKINMEKHVYLPNLPEKFFQHMSKSALAVYPVICSKANFEWDAWIQLPQEHIAKMAGLSIDTVAKGINNLVAKGYVHVGKDEIEIPLLRRQKVTEGARHFYIYKAGFIRREQMQTCKGTYFIFYTCIIDSGIWAKLSPRAKALYLAMRSKANFDPEIYSMVENVDLDGMALNDLYNIDGQFRNRKWDVCELSLSELCRFADIGRSNIKPVLDQLEHYRLAEWMEPVFKVYLKPQIKIRSCPNNNYELAY